MDDGISNTSNIKSLKFPMIIKLCLGCYYCESGSSKGFIEWIPYDEFKDIIHTTINKETYSALLLKGSICGWDKDKFNWSRKIKKVTLVNCEHDIDFYRILKEKEKYKPYGISKDLTSHSYILVFDDEGYNQNLCIKCQILSSFFDWCKSCKLNHFQLNYGESPSGNDEIDKILKGYYCESARFIEWISYEEFKDITHNVVNKETYSALWLKGCIYDWNKDEFNWNRKIIKVVLAKSKCIISDLYGILKVGKYMYQPYGITKNPVSLNYLLIFEYSTDFLKLLNKPKDYQIIDISKDEKHKDNLITYYLKNISHFSYSYCKFKISFFNWCKSCKLNHFRFNYGEFPSGNDEIDNILKDNYCERFLQEVQSYYKIGFSHKITKLYDICEDGLRPETRENTPKCLVHLLNKCWDATPLNRPTVDEIIQKLNHFETEDIIFEELRNYNNEVIKQYFESNSKSDHLKTSNSSKLHSTNPSNFTELLDCCISNENEEPGSASTSRNNYQVANSSNELVINNNSECYDCVIESNLLSDNYM
ncbi:unnamed protein product [Rhizophagus irregularis]|nr:unnamed protein product [Rhizophagus irregularis]